MRSRYLVAGLAGALATALALVTVATGNHQRRPFHPKGLHAHLTGAQEVPGPGDPDGRGRADVAVLRQFGAVCWRIRTTNVASPTAAHIHRGARGVAGGVVVDLFGAAGPRERGCTENVSGALLREIARRPRRFYVNVHNGDFPDGAVRGQLHRGAHPRDHGFNKRRR